MEKETKVLGSAHPDSERGKARSKVNSEAKDALEKLEVEHIFKCYEAAVEDRFEMEHSLMRVVTSALEVNKAPQISSIPQNKDAISAMKDVAVAAIELAKMAYSKGAK